MSLAVKRYWPEAVWAVSLSLLAAVLRFWNLGLLGLSHFDEGSYTMAGKWLATLGEQGWPIQAGQAPPLFPVLVAVFFLLFGIQDSVAIAVSATAGSLTIALVYLLARGWFDRVTAGLAALFLATCEYHLIFSRMALADATFTLLFWAAIGALYLGLEKKSAGWMAAGGLLTGLCWNTKYHGFLPLILAALGFAVATLVDRFGSKSLIEDFRRSGLGMASLLAAAAYLPWVVAVQWTVGYGSVLNGQVDHSFLGQQGLVTPPTTLLFYVERWMSPPLWWGAGLGIVALLWERRQAGLYLLTTTCGFAAATLFYMSFPRLMLPLVPALCLLCACGVEGLCRQFPEKASAALRVVATTLIVAWSLVPLPALLEQRTDSYRLAAEYVQGLGPEPIITQVSKCYYFYERRRSLEMRWQQPRQLDRLISESPSVILVVDPVLNRLPEWASWVRRLSPGLTPIRSFPLSVYETLYYQGINPYRPLEGIPPQDIPALPRDSQIEIYRLENSNIDPC